MDDKSEFITGVFTLLERKPVISTFQLQKGSQIIFYMTECKPNLFWRTMQYIFFGFVWKDPK